MRYDLPVLVFSGGTLMKTQIACSFLGMFFFMDYFVFLGQEGFRIDPDVHGFVLQVL